jgi:lipopolysaccharide/colanic/teichoic acid biosynthesis glycosyltransferase
VPALLKRAAPAADDTRMGRAHVVTAVADARPAGRALGALLRVVDVVVASLLLVCLAPLMAALALAVRRSSHGPVLSRRPALDRRGRRVELLSFRTRVDGAGTVSHARVRSVVGGDHGDALTGVGRFMRATRTDRLPRLVNVVAGHVGLFRRA